LPLVDNTSTPVQNISSNESVPTANTSKGINATIPVISPNASVPTANTS
jgi:hypothetical protein